MMFLKLPPSSVTPNVDGMLPMMGGKKRPHLIPQRTTVSVTRRNQIKGGTILAHTPDLIRKQFRLIARRINTPLHHNDTILLQIGDMCIEHAREHRDLDLSAEILDFGKEHGIALLRRKALRACEYATNAYKLPILTYGMRNLADGAQRRERLAVIVERMPRNVEPRRLLFPRQTLTCCARRNVLRNANLLNLLYRFLAKKPALPAQ